MASFWNVVGSVIAQEFANLPSMEEGIRVTVRLLTAILLSGLIGYERERKGAKAGLRTHMLVALGSALFVLAPLQASMQVQDISRVLQGVVAGIGFLGAGAIIKLSGDKSIIGLTTAASIWMTAAVGIAVAIGQLTMAITATLLALIILRILHKKKVLIRKNDVVAEAETLVAGRRDGELVEAGAAVTVRRDDV